MGLFGRGKGGGAMNVIRCDLQDYLVWKWRPLGQDLNSTSRENSIRYGSSLRVKDGELAVFVYKQKDGTMQDFIIGPYDDTIKTANFPVLSSLVGLAFGGESPFQAEVYFINLAGNIQVKFGVPFFGVSDPRFPDVSVPVAAGGTITFNIADYRDFIKTNRLQNFDLEDFKRNIKDMVIRRVKSTVSVAPDQYGIPLVKIEQRIDDINDIIKGKIEGDFGDFGVKLKRLDLSRLDVDRESEEWAILNEMTAQALRETVAAQKEVNIKNLHDTQRINAQNMEETMRIQREEAQRAQRLQTETQFIGAHALNRQADVLETSASNLGQMASMGNGGGGMNPAGMMAGMAMGGAVASQMGSMMNNMGAAMGGQMGVPTPGMPGQMPGAPTPPGMPGAAAPPPPPAAVNWMIAINGQQSGPYDMQQLQQLVANGHLNPNVHVWRQGMANWELAGNVAELAQLFTPVAPPPPTAGMPPMPPTL